MALAAVAGVIFAVFDPLKYHKDLIPISVARTPVDVHPASLMAVRQLGSCFFLLALFATFLLRAIHRNLSSQPVLLERLIASYLWCLATADVTHMQDNSAQKTMFETDSGLKYSVFTFFDLGLSGTMNWQGWNLLVWGNCGITSGKTLDLIYIDIMLTKVNRSALLGPDALVRGRGARRKSLKDAIEMGWKSPARL